MAALLVEFFMWLILFASITVSFCTVLLEVIMRDSTSYDMEFLWDFKYTHEELHLDSK
ncbi:hypothetical protein [Paenibacillus cremeus]|uniref:hypothetical protein n=1 Tax=Paenibacillus cremeus TaxID=2163881 RepID=UPI0016476D94|nr:hypothetical protein [Paenibacillus cremeus]